MKLTILYEIKRRPELYIGKKGITSFYHFLNGYILKCIESGDYELNIVKEMHFWLPERTKIDVENWRENLLIKSNNNEEKAFDLFYYYLEELLKDKNKTLL